MEAVYAGAGPADQAARSGFGSQPAREKTFHLDLKARCLLTAKQWSDEVVAKDDTGIEKT
jgi:hypothetical protein